MTLQLKSSDPDPIFLLRSTNGTVTCLKFASWNDEEVLLTGHHNGISCIWNLKSQRVIAQVESENKQSILYFDVIVISGTECLISHDRGGSIKLFSKDKETFGVVRTLQCHHLGFCSLHLLQQDDDIWIAYPSTNDSTIDVGKHLINGEMNVSSLKPTDRRGMVMKIFMFFNGDNMYTIVGYEDGTIVIWDVNTESIIDSEKVFNDPVMCLDVHQKKRKLICGSAEKSIHCFIICEDMKLEKVSTTQCQSTGFSSLSIREDGKIFCIGCWDGKIRVFSLKTLKLLAILKYHEKTVDAIAFNIKQYIVGGCKDGRISFWDVYTNA